jgi:hypothetical protein
MRGNGEKMLQVNQLRMRVNILASLAYSWFLKTLPIINMIGDQVYLKKSTATGVHNLLYVVQIPKVFQKY